MKQNKKLYLCSNILLLCLIHATKVVFFCRITNIMMLKRQDYYYIILIINIFIVSRVIQADTLVPNNLLKQKIHLWL